jgi:hypothetical protein
MARDVLMERRVAQAGTVQARSTAVDTEAWNARPTQRHKALREGSSSLVESRRCLMKALCNFFGRIRVHATKRVESKRNEEKAVPVTDLPVRPDVVVVEPLKGRHGASPSASSVLYTINSGRITDGHVQNVRPPALIGDMEVRPFAGRDAILIGLKRELIRGGVTPPVGVRVLAIIVPRSTTSWEAILGGVRLRGRRF